MLSTKSLKQYNEAAIMGLNGFVGHKDVSTRGIIYYDPYS